MAQLSNSEAEIKVQKQQIEKAILALRTVKGGQSKEKKNILVPDNNEKIWLQFTFKMIPELNNKNKILKLPHSMTTDISSVCIFVKDLDKKDRDYEPTISHFKDYLQSKGLSSTIDVMPLKQLKLEYKPFEAKRNLVNMYDIFLVDARILKFVPPLLGRAFFKKKKQPSKINLQAQNLKKEFDDVVSRGRCVIECKGSTSSAHVANMDMNDKNMKENIIAATEQLLKSAPGGQGNIRNFYIKTDKSIAIPIYISLGPSNEVELPEEKQEEQDEAEELSTFMHAKVRVSRHGDVFVDVDENASDGEYEFDDDMSSDDDGFVQRFTGKKTKDGVKGAAAKRGKKTSRTTPKKRKSTVDIENTRAKKKKTDNKDVSALKKIKGEGHISVEVKTKKGETQKKGVSAKLQNREQDTSHKKDNVKNNKKTKKSKSFEGKNVSAENSNELISGMSENNSDDSVTIKRMKRKLKGTKITQKTVKRNKYEKASKTKANLIKKKVK